MSTPKPARAPLESRELSELRSRIDSLDDQILALLDDRARAATELAAIKRKMMARRTQKSPVRSLIK